MSSSLAPLTGSAKASRGTRSWTTTLTWLTNTAISAARLYRENKPSFFAPMGVTVPIAVSAFPDDLYQAPRSWVQRAYPKLIHYHKAEKGGHFAAWEQPEIFVNELRTGLKSLRK
jgi:pimeloyl-ACP methyl ester carboxylesterase